MSGPACVVFDPTLTDYDFGPLHPMTPVRVDLTMLLAQELGVLANLHQVPAPVASDDLILTVHDAELIEKIVRGLQQGGRHGPVQKQQLAPLLAQQRNAVGPLAQGQPGRQGRGSRNTGGHKMQKANGG